MLIDKVEVLLGNRNFIEAKKLLKRLLRSDAINSDAIYLLGIAEAELGNFDDAIALFTRVIAIEPQYGVAHYAKARLLSDLNRHSEALEHHDQSVELLASNPWAFVNRGVCRAALKNILGARDDFDKAIELDPSLSAAFCNKGNILLEMESFSEALPFMDEAIQLAPLNFSALSSKSACLIKLKQPREALEFADRSIDLNPDYAEAWCNRSVALNELKRHEEALASCDQAIKIKPDYADAYLGRGVVLNDLMRYEEALADYDRAIELKPDCAKSWSNRGITLNDLRRYEEALASYDRSIELKPGYTEAIHNKAILQLAQKEFLDGFDNYICRWETENFPSQHIKTTLPRYSPGAPVANILLWAEQGLGDEIFYAGILNQVSSKFSNISLIADIRLHSIIMRSFPKINLLDRRCSKSESFDSGFDCQAPIGDLGRLLALCGEEIKAPRTPFFTANRNKKTEFRLSGPFTKGKIICGLSWGSSNKNFGKEKSINLGQLEPILKDPRLEFVNLQYGEVDSEIQDIKNKLGVNIRQINDLDIYNDIDGLLALIDACDIVITTSNVTAHLAGSIGKKGCVLVPFSRGKIWYWHLNDTYSFWYPSLRIVYQNDQYTWSDTIEQTQIWLKQELRWNQ